MTVKFNRELGVFQVNGRGAYATEAEAQAADTAPAPSVTYDDSDLVPGGTFGGATGAQASTPKPTPTTSQTPTKPRPAPMLDAQGNIVGSWQWNGTDWVNTSAQQAYDRGNIGGAGGAYNAGNDATRAAFDATHQSNQGGVNWSKVGKTALDVGGFALDPIGGTARVAASAAGGPAAGYLAQMASGPAGALVGSGNVILDARARGKAADSSTAAPGAYSSGPSAPPGGAGTSAQTQRAAAETQGAENQFQDTQAANAEENDNLFQDAVKRYDELKGGEYGLSDEARAYQQEGLAQQRMLLERLLGFNPEEYQAQFADQALARQIALGRQGTSAAAQQAGMFAAQEQAPALYAEGARQASALETQRLGQAGDAAKAFGELGTMTRGQDETRAQFEAKLPVEIANNVAALTQGKMNLNQEESQMFADIWQEFARLQSIYAGMDSAEQIAWWDKATAERGQDKQFEAIKAQLRAQGKVTDKDLINGLFQLGGGLLSLGGGMGAA